MQAAISKAVSCFHCGDHCDSATFFDDKPFCCQGCKAVYEILSTADLCEVYQRDGYKGTSLKHVNPGSYDYLDVPGISRRLLTFSSSNLSKVIFQLPGIHCASCIWLLENLRRLNSGVLQAEVNFGRKQVTIDFDPALLKLSQLATLLASVGYAPAISLDDGQESVKGIGSDNQLIYKLAVAGFCFGNIMLFSFPEYLGLDAHDSALRSVFSFLNLMLAVPVLTYSGSVYLLSASKSFRQRRINIDVPIAAGLLALFFRSAYDIISATGPGYLDSFSGLVFFLLIGRWFQSKTYQSLAFDRDYKAYFPLAVNRLVSGEWSPVIIYELKKGDKIRIRNMEIVPADSILEDRQAYFDYSFVTGEAKPVKVERGELIYAGGRLIGQPAQLKVEKSTSHSHLTSLWNNAAFKKNSESQYQKIIDSAAQKFTWIVMGLALVTAIWWNIYHPSQMWLVLTSVLMVACPCALALAAPFTYGSMLRVFGKYGFYLKNADVIERIATIDAVVFDKTGTITHGDKPHVMFIGTLSDEECTCVKNLVTASSHPLSTIIAKSIPGNILDPMFGFKEITGRGIQAEINGKFYQAGSAALVGATPEVDNDSSRVYIAVDRQVKGYYRIRINTRSNLKHMLQSLGNRCAALLSGDNDSDRSTMRSLFGPAVRLKFSQDPHAKLEYIESLQAKGNKVMMVGDGLNDSGALKQSDVGVAVSDDTGLFTPACDGIISGSRLSDLDKFMDLARSASTILKIAFGISFFYNSIALSFAVSGHLTPLVAAILMPISSISVVTFSSMAVNYVAKRKLPDTKIQETL